MDKVKVRLRDAHGVVMSSLTAGVVTRQVLSRIIGQTVDMLGGDTPAVYVADFRRCVWLLDPEDLGRPLCGINPAIVAPAALVVSPAHYDLFKQHALAQAHKGTLRKVFTDPAAAAAWARVRVPAGRRN